MNSWRIGNYVNASSRQKGYRRFYSPAHTNWGGVNWDVMAVKALDDYRFWVRFADGLEGEVDMSEFVRAPDAGVFAVLANPNIFAQVYVELGAVTWPGELDLAPHAMHDEIQKNGIWILK